MEKDKLYVFYSNKYCFGRDENKVYVGKYVGEVANDEGVHFFEVEGIGGRFSTNIYDKLHASNNIIDFMDNIAEEFQNHFKRNVSVWEDNYEIKISIPREYGDMEQHFHIGEAENIMNDILENWWSAQWCELEYNNIQCKINEVLVSFRVHDIHEVQFRYNKENNNGN